MVDWATILASVLLSALASIGLTEFRLRRKKSFEERSEIEDWYDRSAEYAAQVRRVWQRLFDSAENPSTNLSEIQSEMSLLEGQLSRHATEGEQLDVDEKVIESLDSLADACRRPVEHHKHMNSKPEFAEFREQILEEVSNLETVLDNR